MRAGFSRRHRAVFAVVAFGVLWCLGADSPRTFAQGRVNESAPAPVRNILLIHAAPRSTPALVALEQAFTSTLKSLTPNRLAFHSEYVDLGMMERKDIFEHQLVLYLAAKYAETKLDLIAITASDALRLAVRHRARLFPGVPIVFMSVTRPLVADVSLDSDVSGVWLSMNWAGTLQTARRLQPDIEHVVVVTGASPIDRSWAAQAQAQLAGLDIPITYLSGMPIDTVLERVAALPPRSVVLLGAFLSDPSGRRFFGPETTQLVSTASRAPVFALSETQVGYGAVGGHVISFELQGRRGAELAARMLRGERPPPIDGHTLVYRFDARQLRRFGIDRLRLPPHSAIDFDRPSLWQSWGGYAVAAVALLGLQTWMIVLLLVNRAHRRRAQQELAARLRFETLISDLLAGQLTTPAAGVDAEIARGLSSIAADLDVDRIIIGEQDDTGETVRVTHV